MLVNLEPDEAGDPHTFELSGECGERGPAQRGRPRGGAVRPVEHEVVDPDTGPSESFRAEVVDVRVLR